MTRWHIKLSFLFLIAALAIGVVQFAQPTGTGVFFASYVHLLVVGWITQMIFGVAYWMFPRFSQEQPRGSNPLAIAACVLLNVGLVLRVVFEPLVAGGPWGRGGGLMLIVSAALQWLAALAFVANTWPRVKER